MLSEFCVRRPVSATMLVMSLVVLGIFSYRDLGVDLFPKADPATVSVSLALPGASPDELSTSVVEPMEEAISGVSGIDEIQARISEGKAWITVRFVLERDLNDAANDVREKVAGAIQTAPPELLPPVITKVDPDADPGALAHRVVGRDEPPDAHRAHRQADQPRHPDGQRGRRGQPGRRPRARNPHRRGHREARVLRPVDDAGARRGRRGERRDSRRHRRAGQGPAAAPHARPRRCRAGLQQHRRRDEGRHADPHLGHRLRGRQFPAADQRRVARRHSRGDARCPPRDGREHRRRHRGRPREARRRSASRCRLGDDHHHPRRLAVHLRLDRLARRAPALRRALRHHRGDVLHPQHPRRDHLVRSPSRRRSSRRSR